MPSRYEKPVQLTSGAFGETDAGREIVEALNKANDRKLASRMARHWHQYLQGLNDLMPCRGDTQETMLVMWRDRFINSGKEQFGETMDGYGIPYTFYINVLSHRFRKALEFGPLYQKLDQ